MPKWKTNCCVIHYGLTGCCSRNSVTLQNRKGVRQTRKLNSTLKSVSQNTKRKTAKFRLINTYAVLIHKKRYVTLTRPHEQRYKQSFFTQTNLSLCWEMFVVFGVILILPSESDVCSIYSLICSVVFKAVYFSKMP